MAIFALLYQKTFMKHFIKLSAVVTIGLLAALSSCKKGEKGPKAPRAATNFAELSQRIALNFYKSVNTGSAGFKASATGGRKTLAMDSQCGDVEVTPYNESVTSGDTTRNYAGNSVFTYICNNGVLDEYALVDTSTTREVRTGFASTYRVIQKYNTRATSTSYVQSVSNGTIGVAYAQRQFNNSGTTTDSLSYATQYQLKNVFVTRNNGQVAITGGEATFASSVFHKDNVVDIDGYSDAHTGYIYFDGNDIIEVTFYQADYSSTYRVNVKTGVATKK
jgi:hypothetical protein